MLFESQVKTGAMVKGENNASGLRHGISETSDCQSKTIQVW